MIDPEVIKVQELIAEVLRTKTLLDEHGPTRLAARIAEEAAADHEEHLYRTYHAAKSALNRFISPIKAGQIEWQEN